MVRKMSLVGLGLVASVAACEVHMGTGAQSPSNPSAPAAPGAPAPGAPTSGPTAAPTGAPQGPSTASPVPTPPGRQTSVGSVALGKINLNKAQPPVTPPNNNTPGGAPPINKPIDFGSGEAKPGSLKGTVYFIPEKVEKFPDVSKLQPVATVYTTELNITPRRFEAGFPGVNERNEWFAIRYEGPLEITTEADFEFRIVSDDGALFYIDNTLIIDNDGVHPPAEKKQLVHMVKGTHSMRLDYFQGPRYEIALQLMVKGPNVAERALTTKL